MPPGGSIGILNNFLHSPYGKEVFPSRFSNPLCTSTLPKIGCFSHHLMFKTRILSISLVLLNWDWKLLEDRSGTGHRPDGVGQDFRVSEMMLWLLCGWFFVSAVLSKGSTSDKYRWAGEEFIPKYYGTFKETQQGHTGDRGNGGHSSLNLKPLITETVTTVYILPEFVRFPADQVLQQQSLSCPFCDILPFFFLSHLIWGAQDNLSLFKGNVTTSQSSSYWWGHTL